MIITPDRRIVKRKRRDIHRILPWGLACTLLGMGVVTSVGASAQAQQDLPAPSELKKLSVEELMNIEVTSVSKHPEKISKTASAIQVITQEEIRRSGASSIPEALRLADNLIVAQKNSHDWGITARGFNSELANKLLVLIDGRTVYTPLYSGVFWNIQDYLLEDIDRIEVISGPGGTLWGANAVNGVINIVTKSTAETQGLYAEAGGGNKLQDFAGVRYGSRLTPNSTFRIYSKYFDRGNQLLASGKETSDAWSQGQGGFRIDAKPSSKDNLTAHGDLYGGDEKALTGGTSHVSGANIVGRWSHFYSDESDMALQLYYDRTHLANPVPAQVSNGMVVVPGGTITDDLDTYDLDFQSNMRLGKANHLVWGLGYRFTHDVVGNTAALAFLPPVLDHNLFSGFVQDELNLRKNLLLTLGTKVEHNDYSGWEVEPSVRLAWEPTQQHTLWAAISRAVRSPSRIDRDLFVPAPPSPTLLAGGSKFTSEKVTAYELGYHGQLSRKTSASISAYYNEYTDLRSTSTTPVTIVPFFFQNNLTGETHGVEISANYQASGWWRLHIGYNLLKENLRVKPGQSDLYNALNETGDPQNQFSLRSSMDLPHNTELDANLRWVDTVHNNNAGKVGSVPSYFELDVRLGWHPSKRLAISLVGQNLLHNHHPEFGAPSPTRVEIERSVYGKVSWNY